MRRAARAVQAGDAGVVACIAGDTNHVYSFRHNVSNFSQFARDAVYPYGSGGPNASFAFLTDYYMRHFGATREDFGKLCIAQRENALRFPHALMKRPAHPGSVPRRAPHRGAAASVRLRDAVRRRARASSSCAGSAPKISGSGTARVLGTIERHNAFPDDPIQMRGGWELERDDLYAMAGSPAGTTSTSSRPTTTIPVISLMQMEDLGFCAKGEGPAVRPRDARSRRTATFPSTPPGGSSRSDRPGIAGGYLGLVEAVRQVTGEALGAAVPGAEIALASGFGMINYDRGLCSAAAILAAA